MKILNPWKWLTLVYIQKCSKIYQSESLAEKYRNTLIQFTVCRESLYSKSEFLGARPAKGKKSYV